MLWVRNHPKKTDQIKDVIQHLFDVQSAVHGYLPETQGALVEKMYARLTFFLSPFLSFPFLSVSLFSSFKNPVIVSPKNPQLTGTSTDLTHSLSALRTLATSPASSVAGVELPPEILDYVDGGRNPDVYTREFVELVQRGNAVLNGKQDAFRTFSEVLAQELASAMPETEVHVRRVMRNAGLKIREENGDEGKKEEEEEGEEEEEEEEEDETRGQGQDQGQDQHRGAEAAEQRGRQGNGEDG
jgi:mediator of RNA polymerase II transcription subunit 10